MEIEGTVQNGVVVLESESSLPEGTRVTVMVKGESSPGPLSHYDHYKEIIGAFTGPEDLALNHDHYIHGTAKK